MLQKKFEVGAAGNLAVTLIFCEIKFWQIETDKNVIFGNFRASQFCFWLICTIFHGSNLIDLKSRKDDAY